STTAAVMVGTASWMKSVSTIGRSQPRRLTRSTAVLHNGSFPERYPRSHEPRRGLTEKAARFFLIRSLKVPVHQPPTWDAAEPASSGAGPQAFTVDFVKPGRGSWLNRSLNSSRGPSR